MKELGKGMANVDMALANKLTMQKEREEYWKQYELQEQRKAIEKADEQRKLNRQDMKTVILWVVLLISIVIVEMLTYQVADWIGGVR